MKTRAYNLPKFNMRRRMFRKLRVKNSVQMIIVATLLICGVVSPPVRAETSVTRCPDLRILFARGSGAERWTSSDYLAFRDSIEDKLDDTGLDHDFMDIDYPAVGVGTDHIWTTLGAYFGGGESYEFGDSIKAGVNEIINIVKESGCRNTRYVLGGYSQGAMVVLKSLNYLNPEQVLYAATFGDPKLYLPEGAGIYPAACRGENLSRYRMYVPDCMAYKGLLGAYIPYETEAYYDKIGTWCNKEDIMCSSYLNIDDHLGYESSGLYEDASRTIFSKISQYFYLNSGVISPHDTAFLIDTTGSMEETIDEYSATALRLAAETINSGGRVALIGYRDLADPYTPLMYCDFESCTLDVFKESLLNIETENGGDEPESTLSAAMFAMENLNWAYGATKSLIVMTDASFLSPDRDGTTIQDVVSLSKSIDPVNIYVITDESMDETTTLVAALTGGEVVLSAYDFELVSDYIMERYDSLPRVEDIAPSELPTLEINDVSWISDTEVKINFRTNGTKVLVAVNDMVFGWTGDDSITIGELDSTAENTVTLTPVSDTRRGEAVNVLVETGGYGGEADGYGGSVADKHSEGEDTTISGEISEPMTIVVPKAPNTGQH